MCGVLDFAWFLTILCSVNFAETCYMLEILFPKFLVTNC